VEHIVQHIDVTVHIRCKQHDK